MAAVSGPTVAASGIALGGMLSLASAMGVGRFVYTPILPAMAAGLGLSPAQAGLIASANFAGYLLGAIVLTAVPVPPGQRRAWLVASVVVSAVLMAAMAVVPGVAGLGAIRFLGGVTSAVVMVAGASLVLDKLAAAGAGHLAPLHFAGVGIGIAVSAVLVSGMEAAGAEWPALWLGAAGLGLVVVPFVWRLVGADPGGGAVARSEGRVPGSLWRLVVCNALYGFGYIVTATFLVAAVRGSPESRPIEPLVWLIVGLTAAPSIAVWSRIARRVGAWPAYAVACALEAVGVAVGGVWSRPAGALIAAALLGGTFAAITALGFAAARDGVPAGAIGRAYALVTVGFGTGQMVGPLVAGVMLDRTGGFMLPSLVAAGTLAVAAALALGARRGRAG